MTELEKEREIQGKLLGVCSDLLLEARYPTTMESKRITSVINKLRRIRKNVVKVAG
jgi:hypothetical protein